MQHKQFIKSLGKGDQAHTQVRCFCKPIQKMLTLLKKIIIPLGFVLEVLLFVLLRKRNEMGVINA